MSELPPNVATDEHRRHADNAAYQAAIERAAIQERDVSTRQIEEETVPAFMPKRRK